jgi:hypothetical protein
MPRPTVMTPEVIAKLEEAFAWGCTDREACLWANISVDTLYLYQVKNPEFIKRKEALKDTPLLDSRVTVSRAVKRDPDMAMKYLERKKKDEFSTRAENDITTGGDKLQPILVKFIGEDGNQHD